MSKQKKKVKTEFLGLTLKRHHMVNLCANTNPFANFVIVVAGYVGHDDLA
jgi:hypothetical protein